MKANVENLRKLLDERFSGRYVNMARALELDDSHLHTFFTRGTGGGKKLFGAIMAYCLQNGLNYQDYIILPDPANIKEKGREVKEYRVWFRYKGTKICIIVPALTKKAAEEVVKKSFPGAKITSTNF